MRILPLIPRALILSLLAGFFGLAIHSVQAAQGIAQYGEPKYPDGFSHFDYVNPDAPKGGTLTLPNPGQRTSFDKFNPFTLRGITAPGIELMFESLAEGSADEVSSIYGLLADIYKWRLIINRLAFGFVQVPSFQMAHLYWQQTLSIALMS